MDSIDKFQFFGNLVRADLENTKTIFKLCKLFDFDPAKIKLHQEFEPLIFVRDLVNRALADIRSDNPNCVELNAIAQGFIQRQQTIFFTSDSARIKVVHKISARFLYQIICDHFLATLLSETGLQELRKLYSCAHCSRLFRTSRRDRKFCQQSCRYKYFWERQKNLYETTDWETNAIA